MEVRMTPAQYTEYAENLAVSAEGLAARLALDEEAAFTGAEGAEMARLLGGAMRALHEAAACTWARTDDTGKPVRASTAVIELTGSELLSAHAAIVREAQGVATLLREQLARTLPAEAVASTVILAEDYVSVLKKMAKAGSVIGHPGRHPKLLRELEGSVALMRARKH